jgi:hypothetical protein
MHNNCVQIVGKHGEDYVKVLSLCALSTTPTQSSKTWLCFIHKLNTVFAHIFLSYAHKLNHFSLPYFFRVIPISHRTYKYY